MTGGEGREERREAVGKGRALPGVGAARLPPGAARGSGRYGGAGGSCSPRSVPPGGRKN